VVYGVTWVNEAPHLWELEHLQQINIKPSPCSLTSAAAAAGLGGNPAPKRDLRRFVKWPKYVRLQRQRRVLSMRLKVPPVLNQFVTRALVSGQFAIRHSSRLGALHEACLRTLPILQHVAALTHQPGTPLHPSNKLPQSPASGTAAGLVYSQRRCSSCCSSTSQHYTQCSNLADISTWLLRLPCRTRTRPRRCSSCCSSTAPRTRRRRRSASRQRQRPARPARCVACSLTGCGSARAQRPKPQTPRPFG
jgi:hypothetical protein